MRWTSFSAAGTKKIREGATQHDSGMILVSGDTTGLTIEIGTYDPDDTFVVIAEYSENACLPHGRGIMLYAKVTGTPTGSLYIGYCG